MLTTCAALTRGTRFVVRSARGGGGAGAQAQDHSVWLSSDRQRLQWRVCRGAGSTQVAPDGVVFVAELSSVELKRRQGAPVLLLHTAERRLALEFVLPEVAPTWAAALCRLANL